MLVEIHMLQNHAPSNLNRDESGSPKECRFGGVKRARISSQCIKRSIRRSALFQTEMAGELASRTRRLPELVREKLLANGVAADVADIAASKVSGFGTEAATERAAEADGKYQTAQTMFLTQGDIDAVTDVLMAACNEYKMAQKLKAVKAKDLQSQATQREFRPVTVDVALFGRMTTSSAFRDVQAAAQVAHALSTHKVDTEFDYFTAVDDLMGLGEQEEDPGADMIGDIEFNSACYYKYLSIDFGGLVDNLTGRFMRKTPTESDVVKARAVAQRTVDTLLRSAIFTTPTGKQNSFAAHQLPALVLVEARPSSMPVSYANAFVDPARATVDADLVTASVKKLAAHVEAITAGFNLEASRRLLFAPLTDVTITGVERVPDLNALCSALKESLADG